MSTLITTTVQGVQNVKYDASTTAMTIDSTGRVLTPARPSFLAHGASTSSSSAGYIAYPNITASKGGHNIGSHYDTSTYQFTAPVTGVYVFSFSVYANTTNSVDVYGVINNDTSTATGGFQVNAGSNDDNYPTVSGSIAIQLSATNTFGFYMTSGTWHTNTSGSYFSGYLLG